MGKHSFKTFTANVLSVSEHKGAAYTIEIKTRGLVNDKYDALTIDPRCSFYKDDEQPKTIEIVKPGDTIEVTYLISEGIKVAFNIIVKSIPNSCKK